jgi:hypothetical protein
MRSFKYIIFSLFLTLCFQALGADTTSIRSHDKVVIKTDPNKGFTEYSQKVEFPDTSVDYRKVYMLLEFGCAPGLKCGEWDYLNYVYLKKNNVKYEISRFITPYGFYWNSSMNWKHAWYFDLTDFSFLLHDSAEIIYTHTGYEGNTDRGWTVTMDFNLVQGEPARIPMGFETLYQLSAPYGNDNNPFSAVVIEKSITTTKGSDMINFKTIQTGHGMDQQENCSEFCSKTRFTFFDNQIINQKNVWRDNCGFNSLFPQAGTWIYDRAGWCPGSSVIPDDVFVKTTEESNHTFKIDMQAYSNTTGGSANYALTTHAMYFKDNRKQLDAAIDDIIAPSSHFEYMRLNPTCGAPIIRVKNLGIDTLTRLEFNYGKQGGKTQTIWVPCNIAPFATQEVELEAIYDWTGASNVFFATITKVNDQADQNTIDNTLYSTITNAPTFPDKVYIVFKSNNAPSENSYTLKDARGNVITSKNNFVANTIYRDTVYLKNNICYTFTFSDEGPGPSNNPLNKDGLDWWANPNDGSGYLQIRSGKNNAVIKSFNADFGTKHVFNFYTTFNMSNSALTNVNLELQVVPNPSSGNTNLYVEQNSNEAFQIQVFDINGRMLETLNGNALSEQFKLKELPPGLYTVTLIQNNQLITRKFVVQ